MNRRDFLRTFIMGIFAVLCAGNSRAEKKPVKPLREAMFWKRVD